MGRPRHAVADAERLTVRLAPDLAERIRVLAARQKVAISSIVEEAVSQHLDHAEAAWERKRKASRREPENPTARQTHALPWSPDTIRHELSARGLRQADLARALEVSPALLSLWLRDRGIPVHRQDAISEAFTRIRSKR